jgi:hypothetical protein
VLVENLVCLVWQHTQFYLSRRRREGEPAEWRISDDEMASLARLTRKHTASLRGLLEYKVWLPAQSQTVLSLINLLQLFSLINFLRDVLSMCRRVYGSRLELTCALVRCYCAASMIS